MLFKEILEAVKQQYHFSNCYIADNIGVEDEVVDSWEKGESFPDEETAKKFSECFAIPFSTLRSILQENKKEKL